jgi:hypothetical protein
LFNSTRQIFSANEQLKNDLDEVEELTSRVRDSISVDLSNTRRYSPLLYEYYRKQLELAKSIQCTYNIQCNSLFDAMTLMRRCLKDYCQTVHNPEYLAIDAIHSVKSTTSTHDYSYNDFLSQNNISRLEPNPNYTMHTIGQQHQHQSSLVSSQQPSQSTSLPLNHHFSYKDHKTTPIGCSAANPNPTLSGTTTTTTTGGTSLTTTTTTAASSNSTASGSVSFASTCSISSNSLTNKNLFNNINYDSNMVDAINFNFDNNGNQSTNNTSNNTATNQCSSSVKQTTTTTTIDNKQTYV